MYAKNMYATEGRLSKNTGIGAPKLARGVHTVFEEVKEKVVEIPNTCCSEYTCSTCWYVQLSKKVAKKVAEISDKNPDRQFMIAYERGKAKMKITPKENDTVRVLSEKNIIYTGVVVGILAEATDMGISYVLLLEKTDPIYIGKYFRRNWNLIKEND